MSKRRKFSAEFKRGAVEQASQPGVTCAQAAREITRPINMSVVVITTGGTLMGSAAAAPPQRTRPAA